MTKTQKIRIVSVPPGQAPRWVRREWVGLELPIKGVPVSKNLIQAGVNFFKAKELIKTITTEGTIQKRASLKKFKPKNTDGYTVNTKTAMTILAEKSPAAAEWWRENIVLSLMPWLSFKKEVCKIVS